MISFDHLHLCWSDLDAMVHFWTEALGASFVRFRKFGGAEGAVVTLSGVQVFLKKIPDDAPAPSLPPAVSIISAYVWRIPTSWRKDLSAASAER